MSKSSSGGQTAGGGITIGVVIAILLSWGVNHSILFAIFHGFCSWLYVIYWLCVYGPWK